MWLNALTHLFNYSRIWCYKEFPFYLSNSIEYISIFMNNVIHITHLDIYILTSIKDNNRTLSKWVCFLYKVCQAGVIWIELVCYWWRTKFIIQKQHKVYLFWHTRFIIQLKNYHSLIILLQSLSFLHTLICHKEDFSS